MIECRPVRREDAAELCSHLWQSRVEILGLVSRGVWKCVVNDAVERANIRIVVARGESGLAGWSIAVIDSRSYWKRFLLRHPNIGMKVAGKRLLTKVKPGRRGGTRNGARMSDEWKRSIQVDWGASSPTVARHLDVTVLDEFRRRGVATQLQKQQIEDLRARGVSRIDAYIQVQNHPSIAMHQKEGWALVREEDGILLIALEI